MSDLNNAKDYEPKTKAYFETKRDDVRNNAYESILSEINSENTILKNYITTLRDAINDELDNIREIKINMKKTQLKTDSSNILIDNYKSLYELNYMRNFALGSGSLILLYQIYKTFLPNK
jgi:hypothetical protein